MNTETGADRAHRRLSDKLQAIAAVHAHRHPTPYSRPLLRAAERSALKAASSAERKQARRLAALGRKTPRSAK